MFAIQLLIVLGAIGFFAFQAFKSIKPKKNERTGQVTGFTLNVAPLILSGAVAFALMFVVVPSFGQVAAGYRGVVLRFGAVTGEVKEEGLYFVMPFVNSVQMMNVQVHADKSKATAASRDLQNVATEVTVNYRLDANRAAEVYRDLRDEYVDRVMVPAIQEAVKSATAQFDAENLIRERPKVKDTIETYLQSRLRKHGIIVDGIAITDFQFSPDFANAIEAKVTSQQLALKAQNDLNIVKAVAQQTIETAHAQAEAIRIQAGAISAQGGREYVNMKAIEKWNGTLPTWMGGSGPVPFVEVTQK